MDSREIIKAKLAEWGITPSEDDLVQLVPAYENLINRWQPVLEGMLENRPMVEGMEMPVSEPILIHDIARYR